jgi:hypothetical protein
MTNYNSATGQKIFGAGYFYGVPNVSNPTPTQFLVAQNMSADFKREIKYLYGSDGQIALDNASGKLTVSGKVESGQVNARALNDLVLGTSLANTQLSVQRDETGTVPAVSGPYTITVANSATWTTDLGVTFAAGTAKAFQPLIRVASGPTTGQYAVAAGVYTFAAADTTLGVAISYEYTTATSGQSISMTNQPMGKTGNFTAIMGLNYGTEKCAIQFNNCMSGGMSFATKLDDYMMPSFEYGAAADTNGILGTFSVAEIS